MASQEESDLHRRIHESKEKYSYFLLAAVGACIGFSITQTNQLALSFMQIPLAIAICLWGLSFYCGCRYLQNLQFVMYANIRYLQADSKLSSTLGVEQLEAVVIKGLSENHVIDGGLLASRYRRAQFFLFLIAVGAYMVWHFLEMWNRAS